MSESRSSNFTAIIFIIKQRKDYMYITIVTESEDYNGVRKIDTQNYMSKNKKIRFKVSKIEKSE